MRTYPIGPVLFLKRNPEAIAHCPFGIYPLASLGTRLRATLKENKMGKVKKGKMSDTAADRISKARGKNVGHLYFLSREMRHTQDKDTLTSLDRTHLPNERGTPPKITREERERRRTPTGQTMATEAKRRGGVVVRVSEDCLTNRGGSPWTRGRACTGMATRMGKEDGDWGRGEG